jgi:hypothetical protein
MQYAYHVGSAQNAWQDSHLAACGISIPSLWYLTVLCRDSKSNSPLMFGFIHLDIYMKREHLLSPLLHATMVLCAYVWWRQLEPLQYPRHQGLR